MYCITQKASQSEFTSNVHLGGKIAIAVIKFPDNFIDSVSDIVTKVYKINFTYVENMTASSLESSKDYLEGYYLFLKTPTCLEMYYKKEISLNRILYVSKSYKVESVYEWELLSFEFQVSCDTKEEILDQKSEFEGEDDTHEELRFSDLESEEENKEEKLSKAEKSGPVILSADIEIPIPIDLVSIADQINSTY